MRDKRRLAESHTSVAERARNGAGDLQAGRVSLSEMSKSALRLFFKFG
jgi:hypothetical protein